MLIKYVGALCTALVGVAVYLWFVIIYEHTLKKKNFSVSGNTRIGLFFTAIYFLILYSYTVSPAYGVTYKVDFRSIHFVPFYMLTLKSALSAVFSFVPLGFLAPVCSRKYQNVRRLFFSALKISLVIELAQLFNGLSVSVNDVIFELLGTLIGFIVFKAIPSLSRKSGIIARTTGKKITRDQRGFVALALVMFFSVILSGGVTFVQNMDNSMRVIGVVTAKKTQAYNEENISFKSNERDIDLELTASNAVVVYGSDIIYNLDGDEEIAPASTAKMLTALTVADFCAPWESVKVGDENKLVPYNASVAGIQEGEKYSVEELLMALMLPSGNDAAYTLATYTGRKIAGNNMSAQEAIDVFVRAMNVKAQLLGAQSTVLKNPDGYDEDGQHTTSRDLAALAVNLLNCDYGNGLLKNIVSMQNAKIDGLELTNTNLLLDKNDDIYQPDCIGIKTGSTDEAGKCLVSAFENENGRYVCVVMGSDDQARFTDTVKLYETVS